LRAVKYRPDGFTINAQGKVCDYATGFAVGVRRIPYADIDELISENLNVLISGERSALHFGFWRDENGKEYIDAVDVVQSIGDAINIARRYSQRAVWDFAARRDIEIAGREDNAHERPAFCVMLIRSPIKTVDSEHNRS